MARFTLKFVAVATLLGFGLAALAQTQQPSEKKHLTIACYWYNRMEHLLLLMPNGWKVQGCKGHKDYWDCIYGCEKYKDPTHCMRTAADMFSDEKHDWERVTANGLIYTIRCKKNCKEWPGEGQSYDAEIDGNLMFITFEKPDNKNLTETFEIFDVSPAKDNAVTTEAPKPTTGVGTLIVGTGFFVNEHGYLITNAHVVTGCKEIRTRDGRAVSLLSKDEQIDLALLKVEGASPAFGTFRTGTAPRIGDSIIAFGFPLQGVLSSEGNLSTGTVAATTGLGDDPRFIQVSAPVQPGNSGSPLLDSGGDVIGIVESKLDAAEAFRTVGDIPENVNFAIRGSEAIRFLDKNHVAYHGDTTEAVSDLKVADVAARAKQFSLPIECHK